MKRQVVGRDKILLGLIAEMRDHPMSSKNAMNWILKLYGVVGTRAWYSHALVELGRREFHIDTHKRQFVWAHATGFPDVSPETRQKAVVQWCGEKMNTYDLEAVEIYALRFPCPDWQRKLEELVAFGVQHNSFGLEKEGKGLTSPEKRPWGARDGPAADGS